MDIINFEKKHITEAMEIALANYYDERQYVKDLPKACDIPSLYSFAENGLGVAAFENEKMIGFLCCCEPFDNAFRATDVRGIFSPMGANAAGLRCLDAIRPMELIDCESCAGYDFTELSKAECHLVYPLHLALYRHYCESPFFMHRKPETQEEFIVCSMQEEGRYFVAKQNEKLCAFVKISVPGETFVAAGNTYRHIRGVYCLPEHRGKGLYQNLLNFTIFVLKREGYTRLGVNFESFNPTARGFWLKYFNAYTNSGGSKLTESSYCPFTAPSLHVPLSDIIIHTHRYILPRH